MTTAKVHVTGLPKLGKKGKPTLDEIINCLNNELVGVKYISTGSSPFSLSKQGTSSSYNRRTSTLTVEDLNERESELSDEDLADGLVDADGERVWIIEKVLQYDPNKGYYVHWKGCREDERSWQRREDMPAGCSEEMKAVRQKYKDQGKRQRDRNLNDSII